MLPTAATDPSALNDFSVAAKLEPGESVQWIGQPHPELYGRRALPICIFGILWTAFAVIWTAAALWMLSKNRYDSTTLRWLPLVGVPFALAGFAMVKAPSRWCERARRTAYLVTDRRVIIVQRKRGNSASIQSFDLKGLRNLRQMHGSGGFDHLILEIDPAKANPRGKRARDYRFLWISNAESVETLIRGLPRQSSIFDPISATDRKARNGQWIKNAL